MFAARTGRMAVGKPLFTRVASKHRRLHIILLLIAVGIAATITFAAGRRTYRMNRTALDSL